MPNLLNIAQSINIVFGYNLHYTNHGFLSCDSLYFFIILLETFAIQWQNLYGTAVGNIKFVMCIHSADFLKQEKWV